MAYDRFLAICKPLHYSVIVNLRGCPCPAAGTWLGGSLHSLIETALTFQLPYGQGNRVGYIFCHVLAVLKLACGDMALNELETFVDISFQTFTCFLLILMSYVYIILAILSIHSAEGRRRAFSTCKAYVTMVVTYYVPVVFIYLRPGSQHTVDRVVAVFHTTVTPLLNPFIYIPRNKEMKDALMSLGDSKLLGPEP
ncbi:unnamed protein product [Caretta caretta]